MASFPDMRRLVPAAPLTLAAGVYNSAAKGCGLAELRRADIEYARAVVATQ